MNLAISWKNFGETCENYFFSAIFLKKVSSAYYKVTF